MGNSKSDCPRGGSNDLLCKITCYLKDCIKWIQTKVMK